MNHIIINKKDSLQYRKLISMAREQLASIQRRLSDGVGKWDTWKFLFRNILIKKTILKILKRKEARIGDGAIYEMMDDYRSIESVWDDVKKDELDYIRMMVHGLRDVTESEDVNL